MVLLKQRFLEFYPDTLECVRKDVNLETADRIEEAVDILEDWIKKQKHIVKKDFSREYLERTLITAKGLVERAKVRIDKLCTFKTLMPELYPTSIVKTDYESLHTHVCHAHLPKLSKEHYRVYIIKVQSDNFTSADFLSYYRYIVVMCEYLKRYDYNSGFIIIMDYNNANILNFVAKCTPMELRQVITLATEGYSMRIKQIHIVTSSKMVDTLITLFKQVLSSKLGGRIHLHKNAESLQEFVPKSVLPEEYGGTERSLKELNEEWLNEITTPEFEEYFKEMSKAKTDESCRQADKFNEQYLGMPGSFRALSVD